MLSISDPQATQQAISLATDLGNRAANQPTALGQALAPAISPRLLAVLKHFQERQMRTEDARDKLKANLFLRD